MDASIGIMFVHFCMVVGMILGGICIAGSIGFILYRIVYRVINLYFTFEQHMSVKVLESKGIIELDDDRRMLIIDKLKGYDVSFTDACKFISEVNKELNAELGKGHTDGE
jgi:hypothetical protein